MQGFSRTLKFKLTAAIVVLTAAVQTGLVVLLPAARDAFELQQVDLLLAQKASLLGRELERRVGDIAPDDLRQLVRQSLIADPVLVQVRSSKGNVLANSVDAPAALLAINLPSDVGWAGDVPKNVFFTTQDVRLRGLLNTDRDELTRLRVATLRVPRLGQELIYVQVAMSLTAYDAMRATMRNNIILAAVTSVIAVGLASWVVATMLVSRVERVARAVTNVTADKLDERIDLPTGNDEVGMMAHEVNAMLRRVADAFLAQERFISHVSHELKTPVAALLAESQVIKRGGTRTDLRSFVHSVEDEMRRLGKLVESFLLLARFGHGKRFFADTAVPANEIASESVQHARLIADQYGVRITPHLHDAGSDDIMIVKGDPELLGAAVDNLIRNAIMISTRGREVVVRVERHDNSARIIVRDFGPGIPTEYLERIFDRWTQVPRSEKARTGSGLGLSIAKGVVDIHGGSIAARNVAPTEGGGAEFIIDLPLAEEGSRIVAAPAPFPVRRDGLASLPAAPPAASSTAPSATPPAIAAQPEG